MVQSRRTEKHHGPKRGDWQLHAERGAAQRAVLVGVNLPDDWHGALGGPADTAELARLVQTAGGEVVGVLEQSRERPDARTFLGKGKLQEVADLARATDAELVVFDNELSPAQGRNLEKDLDISVLDRTQVILDIFARHAQTAEARLQVELAQLQYMMPRLRRLWTHLERTGGGIGTRGPGETQLETDRRLVDARLARLKAKLRELATGRQVQRGGREEIFRVSLVGYTNAGKSTLMNRISGSDVLVRDQLFATLDATTRRVELDERRRFLLTDTVGFIRRLPHHLVESFRSTLQEVADADLLLHIVDAGCEDPQHQIDSVNRVLADLVPEEKPCRLIFNKMDTVDAELFTNRFSRLYPDALFVSALDDVGPVRVRDAVIERATAGERVYRLRVPLSRLGCLAVFHRTGSILAEDYGPEACLVMVRMNEREWNRLRAREPLVSLADPA